MVKLLASLGRALLALGGLVWPKKAGTPPKWKKKQNMFKLALQFSSVVFFLIHIQVPNHQNLTNEVNNHDYYSPTKMTMSVKVNAREKENRIRASTGELDG